MLGKPKKVLVGLAFVFGLTACGDGEDRPGQVTSEGGSGSGSVSGSASGTGSASGADSKATAGGGGYTPVSVVDAHAAIGDDIARIKELLAPAKDGAAVDWAAVKKVWEQGGASKKSDKSNRTLRALVAAPDPVALVDGAVSGTGPAKGASDAVRAQQVDKGISVLLAAKVVDELEAAAEKAAAGKTEAAEGAPHNVDEAWAFFTAKGNGLAATAEKRAADFNRHGKVVEPIVAALAQAQSAAGKGDSAALAEAIGEVREGLHFVFYLATYKYLAAGDEVGRAEGATFYLGIRPQVITADAEADEVIMSSFASGEASPGRAALHRDPVLKALGVGADERVDT